MTSISREDFRNILQEAVVSEDGAKRIETLLPQYCGTLMTFFCDSNENFALRQLAGILVKRSFQLISSKFERDEDVLNALQQLGMKSNETMSACFNLLRENNSKISNTAGVLLVNFSNLTNLIEVLASELVTKIFPTHPYQALKCLCIIAEEHLSSADKNLFDNVLGFVMKVLEAKNLDKASRAKGFLLLNLLLRSYRNNGNKSIKPSNPSIILGYIAEAVKVQSGFNEQDVLLNLEAWKTLMTLLEFKKDIPKFTKLVFKIIFNCLKDYYTQFIQKEVNVNFNDSDLDQDSCYDSDGGIITTSVIVSQIFECISVMLSYPEYELEEFITQIVQFALRFSQRTAIEEDRFISSPSNLYIEDEDIRYSSALGNFSITATGSCFSCINDIIENYEDDAICYIFEICESLLKESEQLYKQNASFWWKPRECVLSVLSLITDSVEDSNDLEFIRFLKEILDSLQQIDFTPQSNPFLKYTALTYLSSCLFILKNNPQVAIQYFNIAASYLGENNPFALRLSSLMTTGRILSEKQIIPDELLGQYVPALTSQYFNILLLSTEDTIHVPLESLGVILKHPQALEILSQNSDISIILLNTYFNFANDPLVSTECLQVIKRIATNRTLYVKCVQDAIPKILNVWKSPSRTFLVGTVIDLLQIFVLNANEEDTLKLLDVIFLPLVSIMLKNDDDTIIQNGDECLRTFIHVAPKLIVNHKFPNGSTPLTSILEIIAKQLDLEMPPASSSNVGSLIISLLENCGSSLGDDIFKNMIRAALLRLTSVSDLTLIQSIIFLISKLVHSHFSAICQLLTQFSAKDIIHPQYVKNGEKASQWTSAFHAILSIWLENNAFVFGKYQRNVIATALGMILLNTDPNLLNNIPLTIIDEKLGKDFKNHPNKRPRTRSQTKISEIQIPASLKIFISLCEMFSQEYDTRLEETKRKKLELTSLKYLLPQHNKPKKKRRHDDDDEDEYLYLSLLAEEDDEDDFDNFDPFSQSDPLFNVDLYVALPEAIHQIAQKYGVSFVQKASEFLNKQQKELLQLILK